MTALWALGVENHPQHAYLQRLVGVDRVAQQPGQGGEQEHLPQVDGEAQVDAFAHVTALEEGDEGEGEDGEVEDAQEVGGIGKQGDVADAEAVGHVQHPEQPHHAVKQQVELLLMAGQEAQQGHRRQHEEPGNGGDGVAARLLEKIGEHIQGGLDDQDDQGYGGEPFFQGRTDFDHMRFPHSGVVILMST